MNSKKKESAPLFGPIKLINYKGKFKYDKEVLNQDQVYKVLVNAGIYNNPYTIIIPDDAQVSKEQESKQKQKKMQLVPLKQFLKQKLSTRQIKELFTKLWKEEVELNKISKEEEKKEKKTSSSKRNSTSSSSKKKNSSFSKTRSSSSKKKTPLNINTKQEGKEQVGWEDGPANLNLASPRVKKKKT